MQKESAYFLLKISSVLVVVLFIFSLFGFINEDSITGSFVFKKLNKSSISSDKNTEKVIYAVQCGNEKCVVYKINKLNEKNIKLLNGNTYIGFGRKSYSTFLEVSGLSDYYKFDSKLLSDLVSSWWILDSTKAGDARVAHETGQGAQINYEDGQTECSQELASGLSLSRPCNPVSCDEENGQPKKDKGKDVINRMKGMYSDLFSSPVKNNLRSDKTSLQSNEPGFRTPPSIIVDPKNEKMLLIDTFSYDESYKGKGGSELRFAHRVTVDILFDSSEKSKSDNKHEVNIKHAVDAIANINGIESYVSLDDKGKPSLTPILAPISAGVRLLTGAPPSMTNEQANKLKESLGLKDATPDAAPKDPDESKYCEENCEVVKEILLPAAGGVIRLKGPLVTALGAPSSNPRINQGDNIDTTIFVSRSLKPKPSYDVDYDSVTNSAVNNVCLDHCGRMTDCSSGKGVKALDFNLGVEGVYAEVSAEKFLKKAAGYTDPQERSTAVVDTTTNQGRSKCGNDICEKDEDESKCPRDCSNVGIPVPGSTRVSGRR